MGTSITCMVERRPGSLLRSGLVASHPKKWDLLLPPADPERTCYDCDDNPGPCKRCGDTGSPRAWECGANYYAYRVMVPGGARGYKDLHEIAIAPARGRPRNSHPSTTANLKHHDHVTWLSLRELLEYPWHERMVERDCAIMLREVDALRDTAPWKRYRNDSYELWRNIHPRSAPDGGVGTMGFNLTMSAADNVLDRDAPVPYSTSNPPRVHVKWTDNAAMVCREFWRSLVPDEIWEVLPIALDALEEKDTMRYREMTSVLDDIRIVVGFL